MASVSHEWSCNRLKQRKFDETEGDGDQGTGNGEGTFSNNWSAKRSSRRRHCFLPGFPIPVALLP